MFRTKWMFILLAGLFIGISHSPSWAADAALAAGASSLPKAVAAVSDYVIGPGDVLDISVWKDETLTRLTIVRPDGFITFPLIGDLVAGGKSVPQLRTELEGKLARYVPDSILSLDIKQVNSMIIYVIGKVNNPGRFPLNTNVTVLQALATAGGLNPFAKESMIKIIREEQGDKQIISFDYNEIAKKDNLAQNIILKKGDVVLVP